MLTGNMHLFRVMESLVKIMKSRRHIDSVTNILNQSHHHDCNQTVYNLFISEMEKFHLNQSWQQTSWWTWLNLWGNKKRMINRMILWTNIWCSNQKLKIQMINFRKYFKTNIHPNQSNATALKAIWVIYYESKYDNWYNTKTVSEKINCDKSGCR